MNWIQQINNDLQVLYRNSESSTGNHYRLYYESSKYPEILDKLPQWLQLWGANKDNEWLVSGNSIKFYVDNELITGERVRKFWDELDRNYE